VVLLDGAFCTTTAPPLTSEDLLRCLSDAVKWEVVMKRIGVELIWLVCLCAIGACAWIAIASWHNELSDAYWTANGHPPPEGMFRAPWEWPLAVQ